MLDLADCANTLSGYRQLMVRLLGNLRKLLERLVSRLKKMSWKQDKTSSKTPSEEATKQNRLLIYLDLTDGKSKYWAAQQERWWK